jgi:hypothetical protein
MARFSREDERDGQKPRRDRGGGTTSLIVLLLASGLLVACGVGGVAALWLTRRAMVAERQVEELSRIEAEAKMAAAKDEAAKAMKTRQEWRKRLVGKTKDEVLKEAGKPHRTDDTTGDWSYDRRSVNPISGNTDPIMWVRFDKSGKVERVDF